MVHGSKFVLAVIHDGRPLRESGGKVYIPFDSEYSVKLKNLYDDYKSVCDLFIDGTKVERFLVNEEGSIDIERFVSNDFNSGKRFKFVPISNDKVQDPSSSENGIIEARFYRALNPVIKNVITYNHIYHHHIPEPQPWVPLKPSPWPGDIIWCSNTGDNNVNLKCSNTSDGFGVAMAASCASSGILRSTSMPDNMGATVEGSSSGQKFFSADSFDLVLEPVILKLKLLGDSIHSSSTSYCSKCGKKRGVKDNYCSKCGKHLSV